MFANEYGDLIEQWKVDLVADRAARMGFRGFDLQTAQQDVVIELLKFEFDPAKSNGATEATALTSVIDRQLKMIRRGDSRQRQRTERYKDKLPDDAQQVASSAESFDRSEAVRHALRQLADDERDVAERLIEGDSVQAIADCLGRSPHTITQIIARIRVLFEQAGLGV